MLCFKKFVPALGSKLRERERESKRLRRFVKISFSIAFFVILFFKVPSSVQAATYYWVGGTTNSNTNNPANWNTVAGACADSGNLSVPGSSDNIIFGSSCVNNATVNANLSVVAFLININYSGTISVNATTVNVGGQLTVDGGNLSITNGGNVTVASGYQIIAGSAANTNGTITVSGSGSQLNNSNARVRLGNGNNSTGTLNIQNGATATIGNIYAAYAANTTGNLTVDGSGSVLNSDAQGGLGFIGRGGTATATISNGGVINSKAAPWQIGGLAGSSGTVNVTGAGSLLNMNGGTCNLRVGYSGTGTLNVSSGGSVVVTGSDGSVTMADQAGSSGTLTIGDGYTMDVITAAFGIFGGSGTASFPPAKPTSLTNTAVTQTSIAWDWADSSRATAYKVYNAADNSLLTTISDTTSNWTQTNLSLFTSYSVYVRATNAQGIGYASSNASATTLGSWLNPGLSLNNSPESSNNNQLRLKGTASANTLYTISSVQYSINGGGFSNATATDGSFDETNEEFYFDFSQTSNQPKDSNGNLIDGYTVRVKSTDSNTDVTDNLLYFSPFDLQSPADNSLVTTSYPNFEFTVNKQRENLRDSLSKYQVQIYKTGSGWQILVDDIPIDFRSVKNNSDNKQKDTYGHLDTNNGVYETDKIYVTYSDESSRVRVYSKINSMSNGTYQWKIVAVDKAGHTQEAGSRNLYINQRATTSDFPLAILNISGVGNPNLNTYNLSTAKRTYYSSSLNPVFYGIAWSNSKVTLTLTDQHCTTNCVKTYDAITNNDSRFGINVLRGDLSYGKKYTSNLSVSLGDKYNELPQFTLIIADISSENQKQDTDNKNESVNTKEATTPTSVQSSPKSKTIQQNKDKKRCFWFICF